MSFRELPASCHHMSTCSHKLLAFCTYGMVQQLACHIKTTRAVSVDVFLSVIGIVRAGVLLSAHLQLQSKHRTEGYVLMRPGLWTLDLGQTSTTPSQHRPS